MTEPLPDTWHSRDLPVLREAARLLEARMMGSADFTPIVDATGLTHAEVYRAAWALRDAGLVDCSFHGGGDGTITRISAEARRLVGLWPTPETALDRMIAALEQIAEHTDDEDTRTRARKILDALASGSKTIGLSVATAAITGQLPS